MEQEIWPERFRHRYLQWIHLEDLTNAIPVVLKRIGKGEIMAAVDDEPVLETDYYRWLAGQLRVEFPEERVSKEPLSGHRCSNFDLKRIGVNFRYPGFLESCTQ